MCGIAGLVQLDRDVRLPVDELRRTSAALARRGPDGEGEWISPSGRAALAHRRLAVIDLSKAAAQPMSGAREQQVLVFNGEIYNFRELSRQAEARGEEPATSDTAVLLGLLSREGLRGLARLRGMFAFGFWDEVSGELWLARDPCGIKPLYYSTSGGCLRFASQVKALEAGGGLSPAVDPAAVAGFLAWGSVPEPLTLRSAIRSLPAGHCLRASIERGVRIEPLPSSHDEGDPESLGEAIDESLREHLVADVPLAVFLSAGLDSAMTAALARRHLPEPPTALTLTFAESRGLPFDEEPGARAVARALGLPQIVRTITGEEVRALLPEILAAMDQPSIDGFNTYLVARLARQEGFKVALSGLGGDELLGGYPSFRGAERLRRRARRLARLPGLTALWPPLARWLTPRRPKVAGVLRHGGSLAGAWFLHRGLHLPEELPRTAGGAPLHDPLLAAWERLSDAILGPVGGLLADPFRAVHRMEWSIYLRNQLLRDADWAGMAHGVEIRVPLVDARLRAAVERFGFEPARSHGKRELIRRLVPELPPAVFDRPKSGFQLPVADWLEPEAAGRPVGLQSRRLARLVLSAFDVDPDAPLS
jgi:asparagine synthase (glutamine-hydrolysing)